MVQETSLVADVRLARLIDESELAKLLTRYAWCVDDKRWEDWAACFTADVRVRMPFAAHDGRAGLADWGRSALAPFAATQHLSGNAEFRLDGDRASGRSMFQAVHVPSRERSHEYFTESGVYHWEFARVDGEWLIDSCTIEVTWTAGQDATGLSG